MTRPPVHTHLTPLTLLVAADVDDAESVTLLACVCAALRGQGTPWPARGPEALADWCAILDVPDVVGN